MLPAALTCELAHSKQVLKFLFSISSKRCDFWGLGIPCLSPTTLKQSVCYIPSLILILYQGVHLLLSVCHVLIFFFSDDMFSVLMASELACSCGPVYSAECWSLEKSQFRAFGKGKAFCPW